MLTTAHWFLIGSTLQIDIFPHTVVSGTDTNGKPSIDSLKPCSLA
jgi:hypothetical protein